jgi:hypothetical protein
MRPLACQAAAQRSVDVEPKPRPLTIADASAAEVFCVLVDPLAAPAEQRGELAGADQPRPRVALAEQLEHALGDGVDERQVAL